MAVYGLSKDKKEQKRYDQALGERLKGEQDGVPVPELKEV